MRNYIFLLIIIPSFSWTQIGISISGSSQFTTGQQLLLLENNSFQPVEYESRYNNISASMARGRRLIIGEIWLRLGITYSIIQTSYNFSENNLMNYNLIDRRLMPALELQYVLLRRQGLYLYSSIGSYTISENLNIKQSNNLNLPNTVHSYNGIIPFFRSGLQLSLGLFTINPFIGYDFKAIYFDRLNDISSENFKESLEKGAIRTGLEFGIMF